MSQSDAYIILATPRMNTDALFFLRFASQFAVSAKRNANKLVDQKH